jgi:hypothetical protein
MANKILFNSRKLLNGTTAGEAKVVYLVPFTFDNNGYTHLHEPNHNLPFEEKQFKDNIVNKIEAALTERNMSLVNISFNTMNMTVGMVQDRN